MLINPTQNKILHALLGQLKMMDVKGDLVWSYTSGRTTSSREMTITEAAALINYLKSLSPQADVCEKMRRKIIAKAHRMRWEAPSNSPGGGETGARADMKRIDAWCVRYGGFGKKLNQHNQAELVKLVTQFDMMYKKFVNTELKNTGLRKTKIFMRKKFAQRRAVLK